MIRQASALIAFSPASFGQLYTCVTRQSDPSTPRHVINSRFREILIKQSVTLGGPRVVIAFWALQQAEEPGDVDPTFTRFVKIIVISTFSSPNRAR